MTKHCDKCGKVKARIRNVTLFTHENDVDGTAAVDADLCRKCEGEWKKIAKKWLKAGNKYIGLLVPQPKK